MAKINKYILNIKHPENWETVLDILFRSGNALNDFVIFNNDKVLKLI